jgi:hypothetical protein
MEKTEAEKQQEVFERYLTIFQAEKEKDLLRAQEHFTTIKMNLEDQKKELLAQNDGLLGAVGRLSRDNEELRTKVAAVTQQKANMEKDIERAKHEVERMMMEASVRTDEEIERRHKETSELRKEVARLKGLLKRKK